jgi:uncharacterized membrane protein
MRRWPRLASTLQLADAEPAGDTMLRVTPLVIASISALIVLGCDSKTPLELARNPGAPALAKGGPGGGSEFATRTALSPLQGGAHGEAYAIDRAGTLIGGYSWDKSGLMHPVTWSLVNGSWQITSYPWDATATSAVIRGINDNKDKAGTFWPGTAPRAVVWNAAGSFTVLGCDELGEAYGLSSGAQVVVGTYRSAGSAIASVWKPGQCRETLPSLTAGGGGAAYAANGDGTIVGGSSGVPVRWRQINGSWQVEQLDSRQGVVFGANSAGDLVGAVGSACSPAPAACSLDIGIVWYATGDSRVLPTLGGGATTARAINSPREVVGLSKLANGSGVPFIWSETLGIRQLPLSNGGWAFTISDVRADGTRLVAGAGGRPFSAQVWVVRNP